MLSLREPTDAELADRRRDLAGARLSVPADLIARVDAGRSPRAWFHDESSDALGADWRLAKEALARWAFFEQGWLRLNRPEQIEVGALSAMVVHIGPVWLTNWCRIVEVIDEPDRFGFVYATLDDHAEAGAERFLVTRDPDGTVHWRLTAVSRPGAWFTWIGQPAVRALQARFRRDASAAMRAAVRSV